MSWNVFFSGGYQYENDSELEILSIKNDTHPFNGIEFAMELRQEYALMAAQIIVFFCILDGLVSCRVNE